MATKFSKSIDGHYKLFLFVQLEYCLKITLTNYIKSGFDDELFMGPGSTSHRCDRNSSVRDDVNRKRKFTFGHCPNHLNPPSPQNLVLFFLDVKNYIFVRMTEQISMMIMMVAMIIMMVILMIMILGTILGQIRAKKIGHGHGIDVFPYSPSSKTHLYSVEQ